MRILIETQHLFLCFYEQGDEVIVASLLMDARTMRFWPAPLTQEKVHDWVAKAMLSYAEHRIGRLGIVEKSSGKLVGDCGIIYAAFSDEPCWDLGIIVGYTYEAQGYTQEALRALVAYCFNELKLPALRVHTPINHVVVRWLAEKAGMKMLKIYINAKNRNIETCVYELQRQDYDK